MMDRPDNITWDTSSYSMTSPIRDCVQVGTPTTGATRYLADSKTPEAGAIKLAPNELLALLRTAV